VADKPDGRIEQNLGTSAEERQPRLKFRQFAAADLAAVQRLIHSTIDCRYRGAYPPRAVQFFKEFHSRTTSSSGMARAPCSWSNAAGT
jgi:hypothetical protein